MNPDTTVMRHMPMRRQMVLDLLRAVAFAAAKDPSRMVLDLLRPVLSSVCLSVAEGYFTAVACDGSRLAVASMVCEDLLIPEVLLPRSAVMALMTLMDRSEAETLTCWLDERATMFGMRCGDATLFTRLTEGPYVAWHQIMPSSFAQTAVVDRLMWRHAVRRALVLMNNKTRQLFLVVTSDMMTIIGEDVMAGTTSRQTLPVTASGVFRLSVNGAYLLSILSALPGETVTWGWTGETTSSMFWPTDGDIDADGIRRQCLVMPRRVEGTEWARYEARVDEGSDVRLDEELEQNPAIWQDDTRSQTEELEEMEDVHETMG